MKKKMKKKKNRPDADQIIRIPFKLLRPIGKFLSLEAKRLERRKINLAKQDPFSDARRLIDNAASDSDANEQVGHEKATAMKKHVDRRLIQIKKALSRVKIGKYGLCEKCGRLIDTDRLMLMPEATLCVQCEKKKGK